MKHKIKKSETGFTMTPNALIESDSLKSQSRFLYVYLYSRPDNWTFHNSHLCTVMGCNPDTLRKYLRELKESGWIQITQIRSGGMFKNNEYTLNTVPCFLSDGETPPCRENTESVKNRVGKINTHNNTDLFNNTDFSEKEGKDADQKKSASVKDLEYKEFVDKWIKFFEYKTNNKPAFNGVDGKAIKSIRVKIRQLIKNNDSEEKPIDLFHAILMKWDYFERWEQKNYLDLKVFDSKFNLIIAAIKDIKQDDKFVTEIKDKYGF